MVFMSTTSRSWRHFPPLSENRSCGSEWDVLVVHRWQVATSWLSPATAATTEVTDLIGSGAGASTQELHALSDDVGYVAFAAAVFGLVVSIRNPSLHENLTAFFEVLPAELGLLAVDNDVVPVGSLLLGAAAIGVIFAGRNRKICYGVARR